MDNVKFVSLRALFLTCHRFDTMRNSCLVLFSRCLPDRELNPQEDSPFLGEIRPGSEQPAICNGLFRAPIFKHVVSVHLQLK